MIKMIKLTADADNVEEVGNGEGVSLYQPTRGLG